MIQRGVDSSVAKVLHIAETCRYFEGLVHVTLGASDGDLESVTPLTIVIEIRKWDWTSPKHTLFEGLATVQRHAAIDSIASGSTLLGIIAGESIV
jgi:hypothetical protein